MSRTGRGPPLNLAIDLALVNEGHGNNDSDENTPLAANVADRTMAVLETTYRNEGLSIGHDFMRYQGRHISKVKSLSPTSLICEGMIGRGACSIVTKARHVETGEVFACKEFLSVKRDSQRAKMLLKEIQGLCEASNSGSSGKTCPCLVKLVGGFFTKGTVMLVLEYMNGGSLRDLIPCSQSGQMSASGLPEPVIAGITYQALIGISFLHDKNILHRDIKPENVLFSLEGDVKLTDFGISKRNDQSLHTSFLTGTVTYLSPERLEAKSYCRKSDVWSLGVLLIELAVGSGSPFRKTSSIFDLKVLVDEEPVEKLIPQQIKGRFREVLGLCLKKSPRSRISARILLQSPWFEKCGIKSINDARAAIKSYV